MMNDAKVNALEREVMDFFLAGDQPQLRDLRSQLSACSVSDRDYTGVGFFTKFRVPHHLSINLGADVVLSDVGASIDGLSHGAAFVLFIKNGVLDVLEAASTEGEWPAQITSYRLHYVPGPQRDIIALNRVLSPVRDRTTNLRE